MIRPLDSKNKKNTKQNKLTTFEIKEKKIRSKLLAMFWIQNKCYGRRRQILLDIDLDTFRCV